MISAVGRRRRTVWVLSELYRPELTSTGHYMTAIAERLAEDGNEVAVLCGQPTYGARGTRGAKYERLNGVDVHRCRGTTFDKDDLLGRMSNNLTLSVSTLFMACRRFRRGDIVIAVTTPPTMQWVGLIASLCRRARFIPVFHDILPVVLEVVGGQRPRSLAVRAAHAVTTLVVRFSSAIVVVGRPLVTELRRYAACDDVVVIPNWADDKSVFPVAARDSPLRRSLGLVESKVVLYAGTMGRANDLETLIEAAVMLQHRTDITIVLCGDGPRRTTLEQTIHRRRLKNMLVIGPYGRDMQSDMFGVGDVVLIPMLAGMGRSSMPSRAYNSLAAGRPIVAATEEASELAMLVTETSAGVVVPPCDVEALANAIEQILDDPSLEVIGESARRAASGSCSADVALGDWSAFVSGQMSP
jgi:colanic acid biosynthesis glycosyl transferase WcaI